jgi:RNA polymerase sigma-70 factor (ECF subfamily)
VTSPDPLRHLLDAAVEGDDVALAELVRRTQPTVWRLCTALGSAGEESDLVQDTYLRALKALPAYRGEAPVQAWLLSIARRVCADHVRRRQRQRRLIDKLSRHTTSDSNAPTDSIDDLLASLDADRREAFVLTQFVGLGYEEAAVVLGCPIGTVRSRVSRARAHLLAAVRVAEAR